ncbi:hypothetical protein OQA88_3491 [Cercophora sp. LCS_1]
MAPEILSTIVSSLLIVSIIVVLKLHEGKLQPELPLDVSLNGVIQFIATVAQFAFAYPLIQALSQLKWLWFAPSDPRPLTNFEADDDACKGGWGSFRLLFRLRGSGFSSRLLTQLAALVVASAVLTVALWGGRGDDARMRDPTTPMLLIICQVVLTGVILAFVVYKTQLSEMEALKGSSIASLCALDPRLRPDIGRLSDITAAKKSARLFNVRLERNEAEYQLRLVHTSGAHIDEELGPRICESIRK